MEQRTSDLSATFISVPKGFTPLMKVALVSASLSRKEKKINKSKINQWELRLPCNVFIN